MNKIGMSLSYFVGVDAEGKEIERSEHEHPYNFSPYCTWIDRKNKNIKNISGVYSDRLFQWDYEKHDNLCLNHFGDRGQYWDRRKPLDIQSFLRDYLGHPELILIKIDKHCNVSSGYPVWYFTYAEKPE